ncbi:MAG: hypothetical protein FWD45_05885, partial [Coriobacteriia bacterium]|nr:hypothetical protein [Coriobacteriia bacterium]
KESAPINNEVLEKIGRDTQVFHELWIPFGLEWIQEIQVQDENSIDYIMQYGEYANVISIKSYRNATHRITITQDSIISVITLYANGDCYLDGYQYGNTKEQRTQGYQQTRGSEWWATFPVYGNAGNYVYYAGTNQHSNVGLTKQIQNVASGAFISIVALIICPALSIPSGWGALAGALANLYTYGVSNYPWSTAASYKAPYYYMNSGSPYITPINGACIQYRFNFYPLPNYSGGTPNTYYWYRCAMF